MNGAHPNMVRESCLLEVPEIAGGLIEIKSLAREAASRTKIAVYTHRAEYRSRGSCVGQRGTRVQTVILGNSAEKKIDIIQYDADPREIYHPRPFACKSLSVRLDEVTQAAVAEE